MVDINFDPPVPFDEMLRPMTGVPAEVLEAFADLDVTGAAAVAVVLGMDDPVPIVLFALRCGATIREG